MRGRELRHGSKEERGRKADKARRDNSNTPKSSTLSRSPPHVRQAIHVTTPQGNRLSAPPSTLPHRISRITPGDPSDWDSQDLSREEDDTLQHRLYMYSDRRTGEPENRRTRAEQTEWSGQSGADRAEWTEQSGQSRADTNNREHRRNSTPKPDPSRNTRNAPNEAPP